LLERTAYHEAGHAVAHHHNHLGLQRISIVRTGNSLGHCDSGNIRLVATLAKLEMGYIDLKTRVYAERQIQAFLAGLTSEWLLTVKRTWRHSQQDLDNAENLARSLERSSEATSALLTLLRIRTEGFLKNHWREVEALGVVLRLLFQIAMRYRLMGRGRAGHTVPKHQISRIDAEWSRAANYSTRLARPGSFAALRNAATSPRRSNNPGRGQHQFTTG
jgi:hypothetical protein